MASRRSKKAGILERVDEQARIEEKAHYEQRLRAMEAESAELKHVNRALLDKTLQQDKEINTYAAVLQRKQWPAAVKPRKSKNSSESTILALASDWHVDEVVPSNTVQGLNEYNPEIATRRATEYFRSLVDLVRINRQHTTIENMVLWLGGDFLTGHIHDENKETTEMTPLESIHFVSGILKTGIEFLLEHGKFRRLMLPCSFGNHGRLTRKPYFTKAAEHNLEWFMYVQLAKYFEKEPRVEFSVTKSRLHEGTVIYGRRIRFHHGEDLRYQGGQQGIYGRLYKSHGEWNRTTDCYLTCVGHWHQGKIFQDLGMTNGALIGYSAYSQHLLAEYEDPRQMFCLIEKDRGMTLSGPVFVT